jgi:hypothetical protein
MYGSSMENAQLEAIALPIVNVITDFMEIEYDLIKRGPGRGLIY